MHATLNAYTVKELREIATRMGLSIPSRARKAEVINAIVVKIAFLEYEAIEQNESITEAYEIHAEKAGLTLPEFLKCKKGHAKRGEIKIGDFWDCCAAKPTKVVIWDDGSKQAVCTACSRAYRGGVTDLPAGDDVMCKCCKKTYRVSAPTVRHCVGGDRTGPRSVVHLRTPDREGNGVSRSWTRTIDGQTYAFTVVTMSSGEIRWFVDRFNGYPGGPTFACAWSPGREWTFRLAVATS